MKNKFKNIRFFPSNEFVKVFFVIATFQTIFFLITKNNHFFSDDYLYIIGLKLFNLIQGHPITFKDLFSTMFSGDHYSPVYVFINQFMPDNYVAFHGIIVILFFISSILVYLIVKKLTNSNIISFLSSIIFSLNYSIHIKSLVWNCFHHTITNSVFGFLSILVFIISFERVKLTWFWYLLYLLLSTLSIFTFESGMVYPFTTFLIIFLFYKTEIIKKSIIALLPIFLYTVVVFFVSGDLLPVLKNRTSNILENKQKYEKIFNVNSDNRIYFYRSTHAPRDTLGYSLRAADNILGSINLASLESVVKYYFDKEKIKQKIINNYRSILLIISLVVIAFFSYLYIKLRSIKFKEFTLKFIIMYLVLFFVFTFVFFRKDLNTMLAFPASVLISIVVIELYKNNNKILSFIISFAFFAPTFLYALTGFEYVTEYPTRSHIKEISNQYYQSALNKDKDKNINTYSDFVYLYYYLNYEDYKTYLKKYKGMRLRNFYENFTYE